MNKAIAIGIVASLLVPACGEFVSRSAYQPTKEEMQWACNERKRIKAEREGFERVFAQCVSSIPARQATGTDDQADIVQECKFAARESYFIRGYTNAQDAALTKAEEICP